MRGSQRRHRSLPVIVALAALLLAVPAGFGAPWMQAGYDAAHTGHTPDKGPVGDDLAFSVALPGSRGPTMGIVLRDQAVFILVEDMGDERLPTNALYRIDLRTAAAEPIVTGLAPPPRVQITEGIYTLFMASALVSSEDELVIVDATGVQRYTLEGAAVGPRLAHPDLTRSPVGALCVDPTLAARLLIISCTQFGGTSGSVGSGDVEVRAFVRAIDLDAMAERWLWVADAGESLVACAGATDPDCAVSAALDLARADTKSRVAPVGTLGSSLVGNVVLVLLGTGGVEAANATVDPFGLEEQVLRSAVFALDIVEGRVLWSREGVARRSDAGLPPVPAPLSDVVSAGGPIGGPTGVPGRAFLKLGALDAVNPDQGGVRLWTSPLGREDHATGEVGTALAYADGVVWATSRHTLYRFIDEGAEGRQAGAWRLPRSEEAWGFGGAVMAGGRLYVRSTLNITTTSAAEGSRIYAFDLDAPERGPLWVRTFRVAGDVFTVITPHRFAVGEGVLVVAGVDGVVSVIGRTPASLTVSHRVSSFYPGVGERVEVDLSGSTPGALGPATRFRVDWGDGNRSAWQDAPRLAHVYSATGDRVARLFVANEAGQESSVTVTFYVGGSAGGLNFLQRAFAPESQEVTFFLLGLMLTMFVAVAGFLRARRRRGRLRREIVAVDDVFMRDRDRAEACEAALRESQARARGLLAGGALDEVQFGVLERHIEARWRELRLKEVDDRLRFLPLGLVEVLRDMLKDGHVSHRERERFVVLLEAQRMLTKRQKAEVRRLVDGWFERDTRRGPRHT